MTRLRVLDLGAPFALDMAIDAVHTGPVIVHLPAVFVLLAAPTVAGAAQLNGTTARRPGQHYGTAIGSLARFLAQADPAHLPPGFTEAADFGPMSGSFIRLRMRAPDFDSPVMRGGTHQGLLLDGLQRELFRRIENSFEGGPPDALWQGHNLNAPLCTGCHVSGDPAGAVTDFARAQAFAQERGVRLLLTCGERAAELGSYPVFGYQRDGVRLHREGPRLADLQQRIPAALRRW